MSETISFWEDQPVCLQGARDRAKAAVVIHMVALATGTSPQDILNPKRARSEAARARWLAAYLMHVGFSIPLARVAAAFGRDRTTVSHAVHQVEDWRADVGFDLTLSALETSLAAIPKDVTPLAIGGRRA